MAATKAVAPRAMGSTPESAPVGGGFSRRLVGEVVEQRQPAAVDGQLGTSLGKLGGERLRQSLRLEGARLQGVTLGAQLSDLRHRRPTGPSGWCLLLSYRFGRHWRIASVNATGSTSLWSMVTGSMPRRSTCTFQSLSPGLPDISSWVLVLVR